MKILVVQLARLGDIYQTWPTLSRQPGNEVHVLVRSRFAAATKGLPEGIQVKLLPNKEVLTHVYKNEDDQAIEELEKFCQTMENEKYDQIINLSFSPFASWLTWKIQSDSSKVRGYTRHADGFFYPVDDSSAYFYAQVGPYRKARLHITHLFAAVAQVELTEQDLRFGKNFVYKRKLESPYWTIQLKASDEKKTLTSAQWTYLIRMMAERFDRMFVLVGSEEDFPFAENIRLSTGHHNILNLCGQTTPFDLFEWIGHAEMHLCPDSMTVHIASLVNTPTLNISLDSVNFWETGPIAQNSYVLPSADDNELHAKDAVTLARAIIEKESVEVGYCYSEEGFECYKPCGKPLHHPFDWQLTLALYMGGELPIANDNLLKQGLEKTLSVIELGLQQMEAISKKPDQPLALEILTQVDHLLLELEFIVKPLAPFFRWFNTERVRIPPGQTGETLLKSKSVFTQAHLVVSRLIEEASLKTDQLCR